MDAAVKQDDLDPHHHIHLPTTHGGKYLTINVKEAQQKTADLMKHAQEFLEDIRLTTWYFIVTLVIICALCIPAIALDPSVALIYTLETASLLLVVAAGFASVYPRLWVLECAFYLSVFMIFLWLAALTVWSVFYGVTLYKKAVWLWYLIWVFLLFQSLSVWWFVCMFSSAIYTALHHAEASRMSAEIDDYHARTSQILAANKKN